MYYINKDRLKHRFNYIEVISLRQVLIFKKSSVLLAKKGQKRDEKIFVPIRCACIYFNNYI